MVLTALENLPIKKKKNEKVLAKGTVINRRRRWEECLFMFKGKIRDTFLLNRLTVMNLVQS